MRNPKAGRAWERLFVAQTLINHYLLLIRVFCSFGPDPYLNGEGAYETIMGVQSTGVQACAKHFLANNQEHWRYGLNANIDDRTIHEMYFYPFLRSIEVHLRQSFSSFPNQICITNPIRQTCPLLCVLIIDLMEPRHVTMQV